MPADLFCVAGRVHPFLERQVTRSVFRVARRKTAWLSCSEAKVSSSLWGCLGRRCPREACNPASVAVHPQLSLQPTQPFGLALARAIRLAFAGFALHLPFGTR